MNKDHHCDSSSEIITGKDRDGNSLLCEQSTFLTTSRMLRLFSAGMKSPKKGERVIYIDGAWDMFHCGHVAFLEEAKKVSLSGFSDMIDPNFQMKDLSSLLNFCREETSSLLEYIVMRLSIVIVDAIFP